MAVTGLLSEERLIAIGLKVDADRQAVQKSKETIGKFYSDLDDIARQSKLANLPNDINRQINEISRNARLDKIGETFGNMARKIKDTDKAAEMLQKRLGFIP